MLRLLAKVEVFDHLLADSRRGDLKHVDVRGDVGEDALHVGEATAEHGDAVGKADAILLHDVHQNLHHLRHVDGSHGHGAVLHEELFEVGVEPGPVRLSAEVPDLDHRVLHHGDILHGDAPDAVRHDLPVLVGEPPHHAHVDPDDLPALDLDVARMGVRVEEAVVHDLADEVVHILLSNFMQVVSACGQRLPVVDCDAVDVLHDEHGLAAVLLIELWNFHVGDVPVVSAELLHVCRLVNKVHLLLGDAPHLIQNHVEVDEVLQVSDRRQKAHRAVQKADVPRHDLIDALPLYLDDDILSGCELCPVNLGDGGTPQRGPFDL